MSLPDEHRPLPLRILRAIARVLVTIAVVLYAILDELLFPLLRPLLRWLASLRLFQLLGELIGRLPPYVVLVLLGVPFVIIEPAKVVALWWGASGHVAQGTIGLIVAEILSILICDRIFHAGYRPLMRIGWFARLMGWLIGLRDRAFGWAKSTAAWKAAAQAVGAARAWLQSLLQSLR